MNIYKNNKDYKVGLYFRLSKEDGDKVESESISNQRTILNRFCLENGLKICNEYIDDGVSGLKFDRPGLNKMKEDIAKKNINMVIVKDLSRLGRDYSEVGRYIERYFPENNIRFIAIYDEIDTITETDDMLPLRAVMNDLYCKDTSRKFRAMLYNKKKDGMYISVEAPYGYKKDPNKKGHLIIDEMESRIVKDIFKMYLSGMGTYQITKKLNNDGTPPPAVSRKNVTTISNKWNPETIRRMLSKEVYVGDSVQGKTKKINYKSKKIINTPEDEWIINKNTHEPIIDKCNFEKVQKLLSNNKSSKVNKHNYLLKGLLVCKECGRKLAIITKKDKYKDKVTIRRYCMCSSASKPRVGNEKCSVTYINYDEIEKVIIEEIKKVMKKYLSKIDFTKIKEKYSTMINAKINLYKQKIDKIELDIKGINDKIDKAYLDKLDGIIDNIDYDRIYNILIKKREELEKTLTQTKVEGQNYNIDNNKILQDEELKKTVKHILKSTILKKDDLTLLIDNIYINKEKNIEIMFNFKELNVVSGLL